MKRITVLLLLTIFACGAEAKPRKHFYTDPKWWVGEAVIGAAIAADAHSTSRGVGMGLHESNTWAFGSQPSNGRIAGVSLGYFAIQTSLHAAAWHVTHHVPLADSCTMVPMDDRGRYHCTEFTQDHLGWRILGYTALPATVAIINVHNAVRNYTLKEKH